MAKNIKVKTEDCISSIAFKEGFFADFIWEHDGNKKLVENRDSGYSLLEGDSVYIPEKDLGCREAEGGQRHVFVRKGIPEYLKARHLDEFGRHRNGQYFKLWIDAEAPQIFRTNSKGFVKVKISPLAKRAVIEYSDGWVVQVELGGMGPLNTISGVQKRLLCLGYECDVTNICDQQTKDVICRFQKEFSLMVDGDFESKELQAQLKNIFDSADYAKQKALRQLQ